MNLVNILSLFYFINIVNSKLSTFTSLISQYGFQSQAFSIITKDDYLLTLHRIVNPKLFNLTYNIKRKPVLLLPPLPGSSSAYFINTPYINNTSCGDNFGFCLLFTNRYDVWIPNIRGDLESKTKVSNNNIFWNFTFDQIIEFDIPPVIDFILNITGHEKVSIVSHSHGGTIGYGFLSTQTKYLKNIDKFISWAPAVFLGNMTSPIKRLDFLLSLFQHVDGEFEPTSDLARIIFKIICKGFVNTCGNLTNLIGGETKHLNSSRLEYYLNYVPNSISIRNIVHLGQLYKNNNFAYYDYGSTLNKKIYNATKPPLYPLENITNTKIIIFNGEHDTIVTQKDINRLKNILDKNNSVIVETIATVNHMDFSIGMDAGKLIYDKTIKYLDSDL